MGRTSGRRAARSFCEAILWQNDRLLGCWATRRWRLWLFTIYKKFPEILVGNFRWVRTVRVVYLLSEISGLLRRAKLDSSYNMKLVRNSRNFCRRISIRNVPIGKTGLPFQNFRLSREFSSGTKQKIVYHLHPNRNFREFVVNGKQPICLTFARYQALSSE